MKTRTHQNQIIRQAWVLAALLAGTFLAPVLLAQPAERGGDNRFLLIFDTSSDMRARFPAVQKALDTLLATSVNGQLHSGDSFGVWTFDQDLHAGQFPLQYWVPENATLIASNITKFVKKQHYLNKTGFGALQPALNQVVQDSERLTVLIFCDGKGEIHGTPYDAGINRIFQQRESERQKEELPIVIGLRSQRGRYVGCMVSFPPQPVNLPEFPPLPEIAHEPPVAPAPAPPSTPRSSVPSLIIIGTPHTNRAPPALKPVPASPPLMTATSTPAPAVANEVIRAPLVQTNTVPVQTNIVATAPPGPAKPAVPPPENSGTGFRETLAIGVAFLAGGLVVFIFMFRRTR